MNHPPIRLTIRDYTFRIPRCFAEGHQLTAGEAQAFNQLFAENVRNNVDQWVQNACSEAGDLLSVEDCADLQARIEQYAQQYKFVLREPAVRFGPLETELVQIATERCLQQGLMPGEGAWETQHADEMQSPEVQHEARTRLRAKRAVGKRAAAELKL